MTYPKRIALLVFIVYVCFGFITLGDYSITWDEPENFAVGRRALGLAMPLPFRDDGLFERYPPFAATIASLFSFLFAETIPIWHPVTAHHAAIVVITAAGVAALFSLTYLLTKSVQAAVVAAVAAGFHPLVFAHAHNNIKDAPSLATIAIAFLFIFKKNYLLAGIFTGVAIATKLSGLLVVPIAIFCFIKEPKKLLLFGMGTVISLLLFWPWILTDPVTNIHKIQAYAREVGHGLPVILFGQEYGAGTTAPWYYGLVYFFLTTPLLFFTFGVFGVHWLPLAWLGITLGRTLLPGAVVYNGIRQELDAFGALAIMVGVGWYRLCKNKIVFGNFSILFFALYVFYIHFSYHPYQNVFYNVFAGERSTLPSRFEFDYWGTSLGDMVAWVNKNTDEGAINTNWIQLDGSFFPGNTRKIDAASADYFLFPNAKNFFGGGISYWKNNGTMLYKVVRNGADIGYIFTYK